MTLADQLMNGVSMHRYLPANKDGTLHQQAQYWLEKAVAFEAQGKDKEMNMSFNMALKKETEATAG